MLEYTLDTITWMAGEIIATFSNLFAWMYENTIGDVIADLPLNIIPAWVIQFFDVTGITLYTHLELLIATGLPAVMAYTIIKWIIGKD